MGLWTGTRSASILARAINRTTVCYCICGPFLAPVKLMQQTTELGHVTLSTTPQYDSTEALHSLQVPASHLSTYITIAALAATARFVLLSVLPSPVIVH